VDLAPEAWCMRRTNAILNRIDAPSHAMIEAPDLLVVCLQTNSFVQGILNTTQVCC
jgi:hypothetical protein